jgi:hypothetical protein
MANSVFYDIADTPEEAANLTARGLLMIAIEQLIKEEGWTQSSGVRSAEWQDRQVQPRRPGQHARAGRPDLRRPTYRTSTGAGQEAAWERFLHFRGEQAERAQ